MITRPAQPAEPPTAPHRRRRHLPLGLLLALLVLIPTTGFAVLGLQRVSAERAHADDAVQVVEVVELQRAVGQVYPAAQVERIAMQGLAHIDALGVPRDLVVSFAGVDLEAYSTRNEEQLDLALDELAAGYGRCPIGDGIVLSDALADFRSRLATVRELSARRDADAEEVERLFDDLFDVLGRALDTAPSPDEASSEHASQRLRLDALSNALVSGGEQVETVLESALDGTTSQRVERATAVHAADLETLERLVDDEHRSTFTRLRTELLTLPRLPTLTDAELADDLAAAVNPVLVADTANVIVAEIDYLEHLRSAAADYQEAVARDVEGAADRAAARSQQVQLVVWTTISVTFGLIVLIAWSVLSSIHRLTQRAAAIGNGQLDLDPLPVRGPREVQRLTATVNGMHDVLQRANAEIQRLATGDLERPAVSLPGAIGEALRDSVKHLAEVTGRLQRSEQLASAIVSQAGDAIWTVDRHDRIRSANHAGELLVGMPADEQLGRTLSEFLTTSGEGLGGEGVVTNVRGTVANVLVSSHTIELDDEPIVTVIAHDISERSKFEQRLHYQAHHDALTGLPNRFAVLEHLEQAVTEERSLAVLFVDLDGFKSVNDIHGHAVGDRVLANVARRLARHLARDQFLGRLGGDEFVVVTDGGADDAVRLGQRLIAELERPQEHDGKTFALSASVGVSISLPGTTALDTIRQADNAVYQAKHRGRGRVEVFDRSMQEQMEHDAELELALRHAVRNGELTLHYQPVVDLADGRIVSAEALVRWQRPGFETVMPGDFIPIAERTSLIFEIERWVLHTACRRLAEWRERSPDVRVRIAVNISGRHLIQGKLLEDVDATLAETGADPAMLEFELTETQLVEDVERATAILTALRRRGIRIAIDDFGTGYSSMTYLRELPIDIVKIDRSFVAGSPERAYDATVIDALVTIGKALRLEIVAEGVETPGQLADARARGCDRAQGFLLGRPGPVDELETRMFAGASYASVG